MAKTVAEIRAINEAGSYHADWASLSQMPVPKWFRQAKFGIFTHWGLYTVPEYSNEWYSRNMYIKGMPAYEHHIKTYGPQRDFGYKDLIPLFTAPKFDPNEWVALFKKAGAQYYFPVAEHHDGFQMYQSDLSHYNAAEMGPHRDIIGELRQAALDAGLHFCTSNHRAEHWWFMSHGKEFDSDIKEPLHKGDFYWPAMPEPNNQDLYSKPYPTTEYLDDWLMRVCELIDHYQPEMLYFDWWIQHEAFKPYLKEMTAYYYNRATEWGKNVGICYKYDALAWDDGIPDVERGGFEQQKPFYWQTDTAIANNSWCYTDDLDYKDTNEILISLLDAVAKNGNLLLNVGPRADGSIAETDRRILGEIGDWLSVNGEGIYGSTCWKLFGEGPTNIKEGMFQDLSGLHYGSQDVRYTANHSNVYAYILNPEGKTAVTLTAFRAFDDADQPAFHAPIKDVVQLGSGPVDWHIDAAGLQVTINATDANRPLGLKIIVE
ncbi:alpha-L-fucosidase [Lacticaseibacillus mingshuiensis]|uniref:alpha-L-fucosidase n=1 Tax=Lacticaseibacillus mingshuiensis TaxID=2799574 RepID=UPI001950E1B1|nr:alpha-L-fucosidase [Lacticaseibacillus mingshuiensis]